MNEATPALWHHPRISDSTILIAQQESGEVAVAAWRYLVQAAAVRAGERVLVHGGAGGTGSMIVQWAKARGAYVIATASARNQEYLLSIGADEQLDYRATRFEDAVHNIDVVSLVPAVFALDCAGELARNFQKAVTTSRGIYHLGLSWRGS